MPMQSTKHYPHSLGWSCTFRQPFADSHCHRLHGYAPAISLTFQSHEPDKNGWVMDFGGLKPVKAYLEDFYDHKTIIAQADPALALFKELHERDVINLRVLPHVGMEAFARCNAEWIIPWLDKDQGGRVWLHSLEVAEHPGNSAIFLVPR